MKAYYKNLTQSGKIKPDDAQENLANALDELKKHLTNFQRIKKGFIARLLGKSAQPPRGIFIYGKVGRGKSMLMDGFYKILPFKQKLRRHFHEFMQEVHERIHIFRSQGANDPVKQAALEIIKGKKILCLDEYEVRDVTDAMILSKLFSAMIEKKVVLVFTSNKPPSEHYKDGLQRASYLEFCKLLEQYVDIISLDSKQDYRLLAEQSAENYFTPLGYESTQSLKNKFKSLTEDAVPKTVKLKIKGRELEIKAVGKTAWATFNELCSTALGTADYLAIAKKFDTLFLDGIPIMDEENRNEAQRFINLIDVLYENKTRLICSAAAQPADLYNGHSGGFEFNRTASRLIEMKS